MKKEIKIICDIIIKHLTGVCDFKITKFRDRNTISLKVETSIPVRFGDEYNQIEILRIISNCIDKERIPHYFIVSYRQFEFNIDDIRKRNIVNVIYNSKDDKNE